MLNNTEVTLNGKESVMRISEGCEHEPNNWFHVLTGYLSTKNQEIRWPNKRDLMRYMLEYNITSWMKKPSQSADYGYHVKIMSFNLLTKKEWEAFLDHVEIDTEKDIKVIQKGTHTLCFIKQPMISY
jgi:hypothetical protein